MKFLKTLLSIICLACPAMGDEVPPQQLPEARTEAQAVSPVPHKVGEIVLAVLSDGTMRIERSSGDYEKLLNLNATPQESATANADKADRDLPVSVPTAEDRTEPKHQLGEIIINILADGSIKAGDSVIGLKDLQARMEEIAAQYENQPVRIRGDGGVAYQRIVEVIDTCQKAGIWNISFATQKPTPNR
jgi:biopolymer transport protein ExbD